MTLRRVLRILGWVTGAAGVVFAGLIALGWYTERAEAEKRCTGYVTNVRAMIDKQRANGLLDQDHGVAAQHGLATMRQACANHDLGRAEALGMNIAIFLALASDGKDVRQAAPDQPAPDGTKPAP